jgi:hypothetical protein
MPRMLEKIGKEAGPDMMAHFVPALTDQRGAMAVPPASPVIAIRKK